MAYSNPEQKKAAFKKWCEANKEHIKEYRRRYRKEHPNYMRDSLRLFRERHPDLEKLHQDKYRRDHQKQKNAASRKWEIANRERKAARRRLRYRENVENARSKNNEKMRRFRAAHPEHTFLRNAIKQIFHYAKGGKSEKSLAYLGCSLGFLRNHLEGQFKTEMTWENYGKVWEIDHAVPVAWFPFNEDPSLLFVASHWSNLRPMFKKENSAKGARYAA